MDNFGVIELASARTTNAPGWAYVPDTGPFHQQAQPAKRKRARGGNQAGGPGGALSSADVSARQEAKTRKEIEVLDRDNHRDVQIAIPPKPGRSQHQQQKKHTPNVRKILQSQKTFANHLDDFVAAAAAAGNNPAPGAASASAAIVPPTSSSSSSRAAASAANANLKKSRTTEAAPSRGASTAAHTIKQEEDVDMADAPPSLAAPQADDSDRPRPRSTILTPYVPPQPPNHPSPGQSAPPPPPPHPLSSPPSDPLLASLTPPLPTDAELRALLSAPPLSYLEVRALSSSGVDRPRYPARVFCGVCGYWGRVRCVKCGARVCALECLEAHREECFTRYGL